MRVFRLIETDPRPGCRQIDVQGELDLAVAAQLQEAIDRAADRQQILIGLGDCDFIDSTGIAVIVRAYRHLAKAGRRLAVYRPTDQVLRVLTVSGLTVNGLVFETPEEAAAGLSAEAGAVVGDEGTSAQGH